jgi:Na+/proline symporter
MTSTYLHLVLNHIPVLGTLFVTFLLAWGLKRKSGEVLKAGFFALVCITLLAIAAYLTGESAEKEVEGLAWISMEAVHRHDDAAAFAFTGQLLAGILGGVALFLGRKHEFPPRWSTWTVFLLCLVVSGLMIWTARLGGQINHPELRNL